MTYVYDDGGREAAGFRGSAGDCVTRAVSIASGRPYIDVYAAFADGSANERKSRGRSARNGVRTSRAWFKKQMEAWGFRWVPTMQIGSGCKTHLRDGELPIGRIVAAVSRHYVAVIDGVVRDTFDPTRGGTRCVYGYWVLAENHNAQEED